MDMLPLVLLILFPILLIAIIIVLRRLRNEPVEAPAGGKATSAPDPVPAAAPDSSPTAQPAPNLDTMRRAVEQMDTDQLENLLEMGATLKPGAEEIFRRELARRRASEEGD